ncbi:dienelactone hydrolase family protein [Variovorax sp. KK3]|uniref:dienelactone hydrolase family protein n=1 Tax=Variovorax sp. KK3 TaxID=1855728 RepID=UPI0015C33504|nr:alpha/beta hydrolase [Variovorax sp. KK3]
MRWSREDSDEWGVVTREFSVDREGHAVPANLWTPVNAREPRPLVLIGHGGSQSKDAPGIQDLASRLVRAHGFVAAAIDGPIHGSRRSDGLIGPAMQQAFRDLWAVDTRIDFMVAEWRAAIDALARMECVDARAIGWWGVSMGTAYGLPLIAQEPRIRAALLGMWGSDYVNSERLVADAPAVRCPVLYQVKWDDQFFRREGQLDLFDRLGSAEKWCKVYMGAHTPVEGEQLNDGLDFLARRLQG